MRRWRRHDREQPEQRQPDAPDGMLPPPADLTDADVIDAFEPDAAFEILYQRYAGPVLTYCRLRIADRQDAEDAAAQILANAWRAFPPDNRAPFRAWLFTIAHHHVVNTYRRHGARGPTRSIDAAGFPDLRDPGHSPEMLAVENDEARELRRALAQLNDEQRQVIELRLAGLKGREIAAVLGRSESAVKMLQLRAMQRLRHILVGHPGRPSHDNSTGKELADAH